MHPRASGVAQGFLNAGTLAENKGALGLVFQESKTAEGLLFWFCVHTRFYSQVISKAREIVPELPASFENNAEVVDFLKLEGEVRLAAGKVVEKAKNDGSWEFGA